MGGLLDHVDVFFVAHSCDVAVVFDANEQVASVIIGKCRYASGDFARVGDCKFEVLMFVLAFFY